MSPSSPGFSSARRAVENSWLLQCSSLAASFCGRIRYSFDALKSLEGHWGARPGGQRCGVRWQSGSGDGGKTRVLNPLLPGRGNYQIAQMAGHCYIRRAMSKDSLIAKFEALPVSAQRQVETFIEFLSKTAAVKPTCPAGLRFNFAWAGGLADLKDQFTAVELQHHINSLR